MWFLGGAPAEEEQKPEVPKVASAPAAATPKPPPPPNPPPPPPPPPSQLPVEKPPSFRPSPPKPKESPPASKSPQKLENRPAWDARPIRNPHHKTEKEELAELRAMIDKPQHKAKAKTARPSSSSGGPSEASSSTLSQRPAWNNRPLRNPPGSLNGLNPITKEPWLEVARQDMAIRMEFGSRDALGLPEYEDATNGLVVEAKHKRAVKAQAAVPWNQDIVRHMPPVLRGQISASAGRARWRYVCHP